MTTGRRWTTILIAVFFVTAVHRDLWSQRSPRQPDIRSHVVQLFIDSVAPSLPFIGDSFTIWYTVANNSTEAANGVIRARFRGAFLRAIGDSMLHQLAAGQSSSGTFAAFAGVASGRYKLLLDYRDKPFSAQGPINPGQLGRITGYAVTAIDSMNIDVRGLTGVFTNNSNNARTGAYFDTILNRGNVRQNILGKLHTWRVDGQIYGQPLYVRGLKTPDGLRRALVYVATEKNQVYAFDVDDYSTVAHSSLGPPVPWNASGCERKNLYPWVGVTSTPAIDPDSGTLYVVTHNLENARYVHRLHALDLTTLHEKFNGPVTVDAAGFDARMHLNRPAVLLSKGVVYVAFGSHCDHEPFHGWVVGYDARTLRQIGVFNTTPTGENAGIWQAGRGVAGDGGGNVYFMTGNGTVNFGGKDKNLGESVIRLDRELRLKDWFTPGPKGDPQDPNDYRCLNGSSADMGDLDLGASGPLLIIPKGSSGAMVLGGGKGGTMYLLNSMNLGGSDHFHEAFSMVATHWPEWFGVACHALPKTGGTDTHHIHGGPVLSADQSIVYLMGENDPLKAFSVIGGRLVGPIATSKYRAPSGMPGGTLSLSYGRDPQESLIWATVPLAGSAVEHIVKGILIAFQASPVCSGPCNPESRGFAPGDLPLLWHSELTASRDAVGLYGKFVPPTVADGKVFVASFGDPSEVPGVDDWDQGAFTRSGALHEYGLLNRPMAHPRLLGDSPLAKHAAVQSNKRQ